MATNETNEIKMGDIVTAFNRGPNRGKVVDICGGIYIVRFLDGADDRYEPSLLTFVCRGTESR